MGKVWFEDLVPDDWMEQKLDPPKGLADEEITEASKLTRVPPVIEEKKIVDAAIESYDRNREENAILEAGRTWYYYFAIYLPILGWLRTYKWKSWFLLDLFAGISVALMVIPQGMSYAQNLAYLPQVYGIYGACIPSLIYACLGSSRHLAVGPVAVTSLLLGSGLTSIFGDFSVNPSNPYDAYQASLQARYDKGAIQVSFLAGLMYTGIGLLRLGWLVNYLSHPVISGFMTGAASIILCTQLKYITGQYYLPRTDTVWHSLQLIFNNMNLVRIPELGLGFAFIFILILCQLLGARYSRLRYLKFLGPIIVTIMSLVIENGGKYYVVDFNNPATPIFKDVGPVPAGMPSFTADWWLPLYDTSKQLVLAFIICILDIAESTTVARNIAQEKRYKLDFTQEIRALGITNIFGAMFNCYTTTGAFTRTSVNAMAGAVTLMSSLVTGITLVIILLWVTPVFTHLSVNVQGAIVIVAVLPLLDFKNGLFYWKVNKLDFLTWLAGYLITAFAGAIYGIASAFALSIIVFVLKLGFPRMSCPGPLPGTDTFRDPKMYPEASKVEEEGVVVTRVEAPLFFGNLFVFKDHIARQTALRRAHGENIKVVLFDLEAVPDMDGAVTHNFRYFLQELEDDGLTLVLCNPNQRVMLRIQRANLMVKIRPENVQLTMAEALARARMIVASSGASPTDSDLSMAEKSA